jgi:squalene monooxygenase
MRLEITKFDSIDREFFPQQIHKMPSVSTDLETDLSNEFDIICVGAGILGCAAAYSLSSDSTKRILLVERDFSKPDRIVGELLQPGGIKALEILGMQDCVDGIDGIACEGYDIIKTDENVLVKYPSTKAFPKPRGISFHHGEFIMKLREKCSTRNNITFMEGTCTELVKCPISDQYLGVVVKDKQTGLKSRYFADLTIVGDGCFSSFRKQFTKKLPTTNSHFIG